MVEARVEPRSLVFQRFPGLCLMAEEGVVGCMEKEVQGATCLAGTQKLFLPYQAGRLQRYSSPTLASLNPGRSPVGGTFTKG